MTYRIEFEPVGRRGDCEEGKSLLECARYLGVGLLSICGGFGKCKACKVRLIEGVVSEITSTEKEFYTPQQLHEGWRLACLTYAKSDCKLYVPQESLTTLQRMQLESRNSDIPVEPAVRTYILEIEKPSFNDLRSDSTRIIETLENQHGIKCKSIDIEVLRDISGKLRNNNWKIVASILSNEIIALNPVGSRQLGLAVDAGTTKIAGYLVDLESGKTLASQGMMNPQISYGEDITSRIHHALQSKDEAYSLQESVISGIQQIGAELCSKNDAKSTNIVEVSIVGNTAIHHLICRLPVYTLTVPPFVAAVQEALDIKARDLGFAFSPGANVHVMPNIAGFIGADHVSMLVAIDALSIKVPTIAIDIGTNTEISLINKDTIYSVSCASGPAFEGGHISCGMRAANGAIERLRIENNNVQYQTIGGDTPAGICGSGIIDSVAQMYDAGILDDSGRMLADRPGVRMTENGKEFVLFAGQGDTPSIVVTQKDIRVVQLGKSAIRSGIQVLLETAGIGDEDIQQVLIAGAFGTYIDVGNAIILGLFPAIPLDRFQQLGNAAGMGARQSLLSVAKRNYEKEVAARMHYIELAGTPIFNKIFILSQQLGKYKIKNGKVERLIRQ